MFAVKKKIVPALILAVFVIAVVAIVSFSYNTGATKSSNYPSEQKQLYTYHDPIHIDGNADFTSENGVSNPSATGAENDPYIIEGWDIDASTAHGIYIENTDVYFIIRNCIIHDGKSNYNEGIRFYNVTNGKIDNLNSYNNSYGIYQGSSSNNNITRCTVYNNSYGIYLIKSPNNTMNNSHIYDNEGGIILYSSSNNLIDNCNLYSNSVSGISIDSSPNNKLRNNTLDSNKYSFGVGGSEIMHYYQNIDTSNKINGKSMYYIVEQNNLVFNETMNVGHLVVVSSKNITIKNIALMNNRHGLLLANTTNLTTDNCVFYNNNYGIELLYSTNITISNCTIHNHSADGISLSYSKNIKIVNNVIYDNGVGIDIRHSLNNTINNCTIYNHSPGIYLYLSSNSTITNCAIYNNTWGIKMHYSSTNKITGCSIYGNPYRNIAFSYSSSNTVSNCLVYNSTHGIYLYSSSNNNVSKCIIYENSHGILLVSGSSKNTITNCTSHNNNWGIYLYYSSDNKIYHSNFINNINQSYDSSFNHWDNGAEGNYWSDFDEPSEGAYDNNTDGIVDIPYAIPGGSNVDNYPFMNPSGWEEVGLTPHAPIYINGNSDFASQASIEGWTGNGTEWNSYIIENYDINAGTVNYPSYAGVHIENTDAYFIIRNCIIHDGYEEDIRYNYGIYFYNVTNSKIENVTSYNNYYGIFLYDSSDNNITKCIVYNNSGYGASLYYSSNSTITNCIFHNNSWYGIELYESANSTVTNCTIYNNSYGISLSRSSNCKIESCTVYNNMWYGIVVSQSSNNWIANCAVYNNSYYGIQISSSVCNVVVNCSVYNNSRYGVYFSYSQYNQIANSILYNNTYYNIYLSSSLYDQITNCVLYNSNYGAYFYSCLYDKIMDCTFYNNRYYGIYFTSSLYNQITNNSVINCSSGIYFYFSFYNQITNCALNSNSNSGGYFQFSSNNTVTRCNISANNQGFYLYSSSNNNYIYHNSFINNTNNAYDEGMNYWDCNGEGNHWGNYTGIDNNGDCIGDIPYGISGGNNKDNYPLMHEFTWWDAEMPVISLLSPCNNSVIKPGPALKFDITDDNLWRASYSMNNGVTHYFSSPYNISTNRWGDGIYNITVYAKDWGMNEISKMFIFIIDGTPPTAIIIEGNQIINATSFTMHWSTNATDIQYYEISTDNIHWINVGTNTNYTFTNLVEGFNILYVRGIDLVNNTGISSSITIVVEIPISEETAPYKEEINWLLYAGIIIAIFIALMLAGIGITSVRVVKRHKVFYPQKLKCIYCQENAEITSRDRPLLFQCPKCGGKSVIR